MAFTETESVVCIHLVFAKIEVDPNALPIHGLAFPRSVHIDFVLHQNTSLLWIDTYSVYENQTRHFSLDKHTQL